MKNKNKKLKKLMIELQRIAVLNKLPEGEFRITIKPVLAYAGNEVCFSVMIYNGEEYMTTGFGNSIKEAAEDLIDDDFSVLKLACKSHKLRFGFFEEAQHES